MVEALEARIHPLLWGNVVLILAFLLFLYFFDPLVSILILCGIIIVFPLSFFLIADNSSLVVLTIVGAFFGAGGSIFPDSALPVTPFQIILLFLFYGFGLQKLHKGALRLSYSRSQVYFLLFFLFQFLSIVISPSRGEALFLSLTLFILFLFSLCITELLSEVKYFKLLLFILVALAVFLALISLYFFYLNPQLVLLNALSNEARVHGRQAGTIGDPNQFGIMLVFPLLFILSWFLSGIWRNKNKIFQVVVLAGSFLIIFASLLVTYSRSAWLAFLLSGILVFLLFGKIKWLFYSFLVAFLGIIIFSFNSIFVQTLINRVISVTDFSYNVSNSSRIVMAFAGLEMLYDSYFVGFGYRAFQALAPAYYGLEKTQGVTAPHNITIELLANVGIVGCSLFYIFLISVLRKGFRMVKSRSLSKWGEIILICILSYLGALIIFYQLYPNFLHDNFLWFCCGSIWAIDFHNSNFQHKPMLPS